MSARVALACASALLLVALPGTQAQAPRGDAIVRYRIRPAETDSAMQRFNEPHLVLFDSAVRRDAPLLVFMPGTGGRPQNASAFLELAAHQGYRVIGLEYVDTPAVAQICPRERDPGCSEKVRRKRIFGDDVTGLIDDRPEESIVHRLVALLVFLNRSYPTAGWDGYLRDGHPDWSRIAVSGLSQGAGMAAYIAQRNTVARAVLFSSPWDSYGPRRTLAPWLSHGTGETPAERWFAAYHEREPTADLISRAYAELRIPRSQVRVFTLEPADHGSGPAPYHPSVVSNAATPRVPDGSPAYLEEWRFLLGDMRQGQR